MDFYLLMHSIGYPFIVKRSLHILCFRLVARQMKQSKIIEYVGLLKRHKWVIGIVPGNNKTYLNYKKSNINYLNIPFNL